jgi:sigma-B regulation protein RsbU (phosphoserine phosphatase)
MLSEEELSVGEIMLRANRRLKKDITSGMFVALLYAVLNVKHKRLSLCSAGQTQPIYISAKTRKSELIETVGDKFPLGVLEEANYEETIVQLEPGDKIILYTDGIVETKNEQGEIFGFERLQAVIEKAHSLNAQSLLKEIVDKVNAFAGSTDQHDDLTLIVLSVVK